jgi:hypothetical protein
MDDPLDRAYLDWLYAQVGTGGSNKSLTHWSLLRQLHSKEFVYTHPRDHNRSEDGRDLRYRFVDESGIERVNASWMGMGCSVLEMLIALSTGLSFEAEGEPRDWFWHLMQNLGLAECVDSQYDKYYRHMVDDVIDTVVYRLYAPDGTGGLFPLENPTEDQRSVELWYQLNAYLIERD